MPPGSDPDLVPDAEVLSNAEIRSRLSAAVRRHSPVPLHHQIKIAVLEGVEAGWLQPGAQLPRERELAESLGVSLAPVRQAMADLTKEGYVERIRGRGSYIRDRKLVARNQRRWHVPAQPV